MNSFPKFRFNFISAMICLPLLASAALAQSGHSINSVETRPGTTAPMANPADNARGSTSQALIDGTGNANVNSDLNRDAGASTAERKAARKKGKSMNPTKGGQELPFSNERAPRFPVGSQPPVTQ